MKKSIKTALFAVTVVVVGFCGGNAYKSISVNNDNLLMQNVDALSSSSESAVYVKKYNECSCPVRAYWISCDRCGNEMCYPTDCIVF